MEKKIYTIPELTVHGSVEEITLAHGNTTIADQPHGIPGTAYS